MRDRIIALAILGFFGALNILDYLLAGPTVAGYMITYYAVTGIIVFYVVKAIRHFYEKRKVHVRL